MEKTLITTGKYDPAMAFSPSENQENRTLKKRIK